MADPAVTAPTADAPPGVFRKLSPIERRVAAVWGLLFFNVLAYSTGPMAVHIPSKVGKLLTQGSLVLALLLVLTVNPRGWTRRSTFLGAFSILAVTSLMMSVRFVGLGTDYRAVRLVLFIAVLWLLSPWWNTGRPVLLRAQLTALGLALASVGIGLAAAHHKALENQGRLSGVLWPMPSTQVAHYAAEAAGLTLILWMCRLASRRRTLVVVPLSVTLLLLSHTRTALIAMVAGLTVAAISLLTTSRRARRAFTSVLLVIAVAGPIAAPVVTTFLARGQTSGQIDNLTGRTKVWAALISSHRPESNQLLGSGLSNKSFDGLPIDNSWLSVYRDQGVVGDVLVGAMFLVLILSAAFAPRGPAKAVALFLITYCMSASFTETGLGDASTYSLDLALAASLLASSLPARPRPARG